MLSSHPEIYLAEATFYLPGLIHEVGRRTGDLGARLPVDEVGRLVSEIAERLKGVGWRDLPRADRIAAEIEAPTLAEIVRSVALWGVDREVRVWGDNTPRYVNSAFALRALLPRAKFVNLVRDGRDVVASAERVAMAPGYSIYCKALEWNERIANGLLIERTLGPSQVLTLRYEDLVTNPQATLSAVCAFLGLEYDAEMLRYHDTDVSRRQSGYERHPNVAKPVTDEFIGRYRRQFEAREIAQLESVMQIGLQAFGYELSSRTPVPVSRMWKAAEYARSYRSVRWHGLTERWSTLPAHAKAALGRLRRRGSSR